MLFGKIVEHYRRKKKIRKILSKLAVNSLEELHEVRKKHYKDMLYYEKLKNHNLASYHRGAKDVIVWLLKGE